MSQNHIDVVNFHQKMGLPVGDAPHFLSPEEMDQRADFLLEEVIELKTAIQLYKDAGDQLDSNLIDKLMGQVFDALVDINYVSHGTAAMMGLPWQMGWTAVHEANMQKMRDPNNDNEHHRGVVKPAGWTHPDMAQIIQRYRAVVQRAAHPVRPPASAGFNVQGTETGRFPTDQRPFDIQRPLTDTTEGD